MRTDNDAKLARTCLVCAEHSRIMWLAMVRSGFKPCWDFYRGWIMDARSLRLRQGFRGHGSAGAPRNLGR